jgi:hypothetical protein
MATKWQTLRQGDEVTCGTRSGCASRPKTSQRDSSGSGGLGPCTSSAGAKRAVTRTRRDVCHRGQDAVDEELHDGHRRRRQGDALSFPPGPAERGLGATGMSRDGAPPTAWPGGWDRVEVPALDRDPHRASLLRRHSPSSLPRILATKPPGASVATRPFMRSRISATFPFFSAAFIVLE